MGKEIIKTEKNENVRWNIGKHFLQIPNLLIDYHEELGIDEKELLFLIKLSRHKETFKVHDNKVVKGCRKQHNGEEPLYGKRACSILRNAREATWLEMRNDGKQKGFYMIFQ